MFLCFVIVTIDATIHTEFDMPFELIIKYILNCWTYGNAWKQLHNHPRVVHVANNYQMQSYRLYTSFFLNSTFFDNDVLNFSHFTTCTEVLTKQDFHGVSFFAWTLQFEFLPFLLFRTDHRFNSYWGTYYARTGWLSRVSACFELDDIFSSIYCPFFSSHLREWLIVLLTGQ